MCCRATESLPCHLCVPRSTRSSPAASASSGKNSGTPTSSRSTTRSLPPPCAIGGRGLLGAGHASRGEGTPPPLFRQPLLLQKPRHQLAGLLAPLGHVVAEVVAAAGDDVQLAGIAAGHELVAQGRRLAQRHEL